LRVVWVLLPVAAGPAVADALDSWSRAPRVVAEVLLWAGWVCVLVAVLAPRPLGLTATRLVAPAFGGVAIACAWGAPLTTVVPAVVATWAAAALAATPAFGRASADGVAYGDESRYPLKVPPALAVGPVPLATALVAAGIATGPLLLAAKRYVAGAVALAVGWTVAAFLARALHRLSTRWAVLVPAGITLVDRMTLADAVLFPRDHVAGFEAAPLHADPDVLDLRLGASVGAVAMHLTDEAPLMTAGRGRRESRKVTTHAVVFAPVEPKAFVADVQLRARPRRAP
jgi:hypothetical protein